jgi:hypothetical protein
MGKLISLGGECSVDEEAVVTVYDGVPGRQMLADHPLVAMGVKRRLRHPRGVLLLDNGVLVPFFVTKETVERRLAEARSPEAAIAASPAPVLSNDEIDMLDAMLERWVKSDVYPSGQTMDNAGKMKIVNLAIKLGQMRDENLENEADTLARSVSREGRD